MSDSLIEMYDRSFERDTVVWVAITRENWLKISDRITQLRQELSLAEEGLANYAQENERMRDALLAIHGSTGTSSLACGRCQRCIFLLASQA